MTRRLLVLTCAGGCLGPGSSEDPWTDTGAALDAPDCAAVSIEPDDGTTDARFSSFGLLTDVPRTLCGDISEASNDGQTYTGDIDYALIQTIDAGKVRFELSWDRSTELDLLVYDGNADQWTTAKGSALTLHLDPGFHAVAVAGLKGPPTDYVLTAWVQ